MKLNIFPLGPLETNCYLLSNHGTAVVIDPGGKPSVLLDHIQKNNLKLTHILLTHLHCDHTYGVNELVKATSAPVYASEADAYMLENEMGLGGTWGLPKTNPFQFNNIKAGTLPVIGLDCQVFATPGHSPGCLAYYFATAEAVFSGDLLFYRSVGRTDFPKGDQAALVSSIKQHIFTLPDNTTVYPGHGLSTSVGDEKRNNPYVSDFA